jgi:CRISPR-associated protein Cas1
MIGRIIEIAGDSRYLHVDRGFLVIEHHDEELGRTPLDDISALIANAHGLSYSHNVLIALAQKGCPFVVCGKNHAPLAVLWPVESHHRQGARIDAQVRASLPLRKRIWRQLVQSKLGMQAATLGAYGLPEAPLRALIPKVRSGDGGNMEGVGARRYWQLLFGKEFRRDQQVEGINSLLNYGYTVLRATVARHLLATGLHPNLPLQHANEGNAMRLVDDLMEPFRPLVDAQVRQLVDKNLIDVNVQTKPKLALLMMRAIPTMEGLSPISNAIERLCISLAQIYEGKRKRLTLPLDDSAGVIAMLEERETVGDAAGGKNAAETIASD